jgi:hypothetical protein
MSTVIEGFEPPFRRPIREYLRSNIHITTRSAPTPRRGSSSTPHRSTTRIGRRLPTGNAERLLKLPA